MKILVLNAGSSSQKSCLYDLDDRLPDDAPEPIWEAAVDWTHQSGTAEIKIKTTTGVILKEELVSDSRPVVIAHLLETLHQGETKVIQHLAEINVVGHRVVHGGEYHASLRITPEIKQAIADLSILAPAHNPANVEGIEAIEAVLPEVPQVAVFDTAFHANLPAAAATYPIPQALTAKGIRRYGFHGISHQYCADRAAQILGCALPELNLITCHLGNGCSIAAIQNGHSIDTTMGFTPLEGLMMGTRSGSIDPGILLHLLRTEGYTVEALDHLLNKESGLKGVSGISADMRQIKAAIAEGNPQAQLAFDLFIHRLRAGIGQMMAVLGGVDAIVFTAGIGENSADVREQACKLFEFIGVKLDLEQNRQSPHDQDIATTDATVRVLVVHTQEDWAIAQECYRLMQIAP